MLGLDDERGTISELVDLLSRKLGYTVYDETHLEGTFHMHFRVPSPPDNEEDSVPRIAAALQEQLGLMLIPEKREADAYRIVSVSQPSAN